MVAYAFQSVNMFQTGEADKAPSHTFSEPYRFTTVILEGGATATKSFVEIFRRG